MKRALHRLRAWLAADLYRLALIILAIFYCAIFTQLAWESHAGMRTHRSDLGQIDQAVWNSSRGRWLEQTDNGFVATRLTDHVEPILVLISPIFWLWDDVRALLLLQAAAAALGVFPLYALALRQFSRYLTVAEWLQVWRREPLLQQARPLAFALGVAYLLAPQLQSALLTEFHAAPLAVPLILWAFWAVDARRWGQFAVAALLVAAVKEEMALLAAGLGLWAIWRAWWEERESQRRGASDWEQSAGAQRSKKNAGGEEAVQAALWGGGNWRRGLLAGGAVAVIAGGWFVLATFVIVPAYAQPLYGAAESTYFQRYGALGDSSADILKSFFTQPQAVWAIASEPARVAYLLGLLAAFAWFSLLGPEIVLLSLPLLLANLLSAYPAQYFGEFHYSAPLVPYFAVAAAYGLGRLWRLLARRTEGAAASFQHLPAAGSGVMAVAALVQNRRTALRPLLSVLLVLWTLGWSGGNYLLHGRGPLGGRYDPTAVTAHHRLLDRFIAQIPPDAALTATAGVHPHVSHRQFIYQFPLGLDSAQSPMPADWALLDVTTNTDMAPGDLKAQVDQMLAADWGVVDGADGFLLLERGAPDKTIPPPFYSFARLSSAASGEEAQSTPAGESAGLQLASVAVEDWPRWRQTKLVVDWRVGETYDPTVDAPWLEVMAPDGEVPATLATVAPPALVWYPPDQWQSGETVRVTTLPMTLPRVFAVRAAGGDSDRPALFVRGSDGILLAADRRSGNLPDAAGNIETVARVRQSLGMTDASGPVRVELPDGGAFTLHGWLPAQAVENQGLDSWLEWTLPQGMDRWPEQLAAFVHLRLNGATIAQADGAPIWFGRPALVESGGVIADWRRLSAACPAGERCEMVVGVYNPATGERLPLADAAGALLGDEWVLGTVSGVAAPPPDQACALVGACE